MKCPVCKEDGWWSGLELNDCNLGKVNKDGTIEIWDTEKTLLGGEIIFCGNCFNYFYYDDKKKKWIKATREKLLEEGLKFMEVVIGDELKDEDFKILKKIKLLEGI